MKKPNLIKKEGFTLVELIVTLAIVGIIIAAAISILISSTNVINHQVNNATDQDIADAVLHQSTEAIKEASSLQVVNGTDYASYTVPYADEISASTLIYVGDASGAPAAEGVLYYKRASDTGTAINVFGDDFYSKRTISMDYTVAKAEADEPRSITITVNVKNFEGHVLKRSKTVEMLNSDSAVETEGVINFPTPPYIADNGKTWSGAGAVTGANVTTGAYALIISYTPYN